MSNISSILKDKQRTSVFVAHRLRTIFDSGACAHTDPVSQS